MPVTSLANIEKLKEACSDVIKSKGNDEGYLAWHDPLTHFLEDVAVADEAERQTEEFQRLLWNDNPIASTGLALSFSLVLSMIADLDRPTGGLVQADSAAMRSMEQRLQE